MRAKPTSIIGLSMLASRWRWKTTRSRVSSMEKRTLRDQRMWGNLSTRPARNLSASRCICQPLYQGLVLLSINYQASSAPSFSWLVQSFRHSIRLMTWRGEFQYCSYLVIKIQLNDKPASQAQEPSCLSWLNQLKIDRLTTEKGCSLSPGPIIPSCLGREIKRTEIHIS